MKDLISIVVPIYNVEKYLERCVSSIINQTYKNLEIILVDDESPDKCAKLCDDFACKDSRVRVIHQKNKGLSGARNAGIDIAKGEYIAFVDSDDFIAENFIEYLYSAIKATDSEIAVCKYEYVKSDIMTQSVKSIALSSNDLKKHTYNAAELIANMYIPDGAFYVVAWNKLYKKSLFDDIRYPEQRIHEDEATTYKLYYKAKKGVFVDRYLYGYFVEGESITRKEFNLKRLDWEWAVYERLKFLEEKRLYDLLGIAAKAYADGVIDLYFQCKEQLSNSYKEQKYLRKRIFSGVRLVKKYGRMSARTRIGYLLFYLSPSIYKKVLMVCKDEVLKERVMETYDKQQS